MDAALQLGERFEVLIDLLDHRSDADVVGALDSLVGRLERPGVPPSVSVPAHAAIGEARALLQQLVLLRSTRRIQR